MPKGFIFDYGGTIDTRGCHWGKKIWHTYEDALIPVSEEHYRDAYVFVERTLGKNPVIQPSYTFKKTLETKLQLQLNYLEDQKLFAKPVLIDRCKNVLLERLYRDVCDTVKESKRVLEKLSLHYPLVLVSNFYGNIGVVLKEFALDGLFKNVIESAVVGVRKPDSRIFTMGVDALDMNAEDVVVVGDSYSKDIVPAVKAGCKAVWIKGEGWTDEPYDETFPERVIDSLDELLNCYL